MGDEVGVFSERELKALSREGRATLKKEAQKQLRSRSIRKFIDPDPVGQIIRPHRQIRKKLRTKLGSTLKRLKAT
jgi:hypothetical protein